MKKTQTDGLYKIVEDSLRDVTKTDSFTAKSLLIQDMGVDSLKIAELSMDLEKRLGKSVFLPDLFISHNPYELTVGTLVEFVSEKME